MYTNICAIGVPKENEKEKGTQNGIWKNNDWKLLQLDENINLQIQKSQPITNRIMTKRSTVSHQRHRTEHQTQRKYLEKRNKNKSSCISIYMVNDYHLIRNSVRMWWSNV